MIKIILIGIGGLSAGILLGYAVFNKNTIPLKTFSLKPQPTATQIKKEVIGFLPFWLTEKAKSDYSKYLTTLNYFSLTVNPDGTIQEYTKPLEGEPGFVALKKGKVDAFLDKAKKNKQKLSLTVFNGDTSQINELLSDPISHAKNLVDSVVPIMQNYGFNDLNLDIEDTDDASAEARLKFTDFVKEVKNNLNIKNAGTLTIDVSASAFVKKTNLSDPVALAPITDYVVLMGYDYHYMGSYVTGPVAPEKGAGVGSEFDVETAVQKALEIMPSKKLILGIPLYGYEWESLGDTPRSAVLPGSGIILSNYRAENFTSTCDNCLTQFDDTDREAHTIYKDKVIDIYHHLFYPTYESTESKVNLVNKYNLGGIAVWALGYEGSFILEPLAGLNR